jgi:hypothetical protein
MADTHIHVHSEPAAVVVDPVALEPTESHPTPEETESEPGQAADDGKEELWRTSLEKVQDAIETLNTELQETRGKVDNLSQSLTEAVGERISQAHREVMDLLTQRMSDPESQQPEDPKDPKESTSEKVAGESEPTEAKPADPPPAPPVSPERPRPKRRAI